MASDKFTAQDMIDALTATHGMITLAAKRLGCAPNTVRRYIDKYPTVAEAKQDAHEALGDQVELTLVNMALGKPSPDGMGWIVEPNIASLIFLAKTQFKERGYSERHEVTGKDGGSIEHQHEHTVLSDLSDEELNAITRSSKASN